MRFTVRTGITAIAVMVPLLTTTIAFASTTATLVQTGNGKFVVQGTGLDKVGGMDFVINYDATTMANPRVTQGNLNSGMLMVTTTSQPGTMRIALVDTFPNGRSGSGSLAEITFDTLNNSPGKVNNFNPVLLDVNGASISLVDSGTIIAQTNDGQTTGGQGTGGQGTGGQTTGGQAPISGLANVIGGTPVTPSSSGQDTEKPGGESPVSQQAETPKSTASPGAVQAPGDSQPVVVASLPPSGTKFTMHKSVLERFREFQGEKTPKALMALFSAGSMPGIRQEPAIALSDGKTIVKVHINLPEAGNRTPNFELTGAKLTSLKIEGGEWVLAALPDTGVYRASVSVMYGDSLMEIPLTVAPRVAIAGAGNGTVDEGMFRRFLTNKSGGKSPLLDLNGDGVRNYIDDYIFTANYLTMPISTGAEKPSGRTAPQ